MLCFRAGRLEGTGQDREARVLDGAGHARVRHVLVDEHALDEFCISEGATDFAVDLDEVEKDVPTGEICDGQDGINRDLGKLFVLL